MSRSPHILIVEDDPEISRMLARQLGEAEMRATVVEDGRAMFREFGAGQFDLVLLDVMLPGENGFQLCGRLRAERSTPIVMLTAKGEDVDRIVGLELGADDYVTKPFNPRELVARLRAILRRSGGGARDRKVGAVYEFEGWRVETAARRVLSPDGVSITLTGAEFDLLAVFCERPRMVLSRDQLLDLTQGRVAGPFDRSIDILVSRLRQKMEAAPRQPRLIKTLRSSGYMFTPEVAQS